MPNDKSLCIGPGAGKDMGVNKAKAKTHPQLSYDAVLIHGLMLVCVAGTVTAGALLPLYSKEQDAALGTGVSAALVLGLWSLVLAVRAWRKREPSRWAMVVVGLVILEALWAIRLLVSLSGLTLQEWAQIILDLLPVFVSVFVLASLIAAPFALWCTRRAERMEGGNGGGPWSSRRRWKLRLTWYCPVAAVLFVIILPIPLFVFCARDFLMSLGRGAPRAYSSYPWVIDSAPERLGDASAWLLSFSAQPWAVHSYAAVLSTGRISSARLVAELDSPRDLVACCAMMGLNERRDHKLVEAARRYCQGCKTPRSEGYERSMGSSVRELADPTEKELFLDLKQHPWPSMAFLDGLLGHGENEAYASKLKQYCDGKAPDREAALKRLTHFVSWNETEPLWAKYLADKDPERRKQAIASIAFIEDSYQSLSVFAAGLESNDEILRRDLARNIQDILIMNYEHARPEVLARVVMALLPSLDGPDITAVQDSAWVLVTLIKAPELEKRVRDMASWTAGGAQDVKPPASLTPEARKLIEDVRSAARKWLGG